MGVVKVAGRYGVVFELGLRGQQGGHAGTYGKALGCQRNGRGKQLSPRQFAMLPVCQGQHGQHAWHPHGAATNDGLTQGHGFAIGLQKQGRGGARRCGLAPVKRLGAAAVKVEQKRTAAQAAALRLHQGQHHLHRNGGVYCTAACA